MKTGISACALMALISLGGCAAVNQQLDQMQVKREAGEKRHNDMMFKYNSDMPVAQAWYPPETIAIEGVKLIRVENTAVEYVLEGAATQDFEKLSKPFVDKYIADVKKRGGILKAYKSPLHAKTVGMLKMWRTKAGDLITYGNRDYINGAGKLYIEFGPTGDMRSALLRTGYGEVPQGYPPTFEKAMAAIVFGPAIRTMESQLKNSELKDNEIGGAL